MEGLNGGNMESLSFIIIFFGGIALAVLAFGIYSVFVKIFAFVLFFYLLAITKE